jgi:hypothetical protein
MKLSHDPMSVPESRALIDRVIKTLSYDVLQRVGSNDLDRAWRSWLTASTKHRVRGLDTMSYSAFCPGVTDAFGEFIARYPDRRVRVSRSDFVLTKILCRSWNRSWLPLEEQDIQPQDCVIMSLPFSGNGSLHPRWSDILDSCDALQVPVFLDGAYFGISHGIDYDLHRACVKDFSVSLSKNLAGNPLRLGIRFTRDAVDDGITAGIIGSDIFDRLGAAISIKLLESFSHDWFVDRYLPRSQQVCQDLGLVPTNTLTLALGPDHMTQFRRGDFIRVSISDELSRAS